MKIPPFAYHRPESLDDALSLLATHGDEAKILAGGQSLLPVMALRLGRPEHIVDIGRIPGLDVIDVADDGTVGIGALVRHAAAERSEELARHAPLVHGAMPHVGHTAIRTQGTVCGSIAHADPAAEMPAVCVATDATLVVRSSTGKRSIGAADFFLGYLDTAVQPDEILTEVQFPPWPANTGGAVVELSRRHGDFALVGLACSVTVDEVITAAALTFFGVHSVPFRATEAEAALLGQPPGEAAFAAAARIVTETIRPAADLHGTASYRRHLAGVLTRKGLAEATSRIGVSA